MSETTPERGPSGGGNVFTRKVGPLPLWAWLAIATLLAVFYSLYAKNKSAQSTAANANNAPGGVDSSLVPQFVNQTYVNNTPPAAPSMSSAPPDNDKPGGPGYGKAGPPNANYQAITLDEAKLLESNHNKANPAGQKAQRPFIWNGSAYVPNTNPLVNGNQYYAGPLETKELNTAIQKGTITSTGAPVGATPSKGKPKAPPKPVKR